MRQVTDAELYIVNKRHAVVAWWAALGVGGLSALAIVMAATGMRF
jgi:hypothetical protein